MDKASIARTVLLVIAVLANFGINVPEELHEYIVSAVMLIMIAVTTWYNNYLGKKGKAQKEVLEKENLK